MTTGIVEAEIIEDFSLKVYANAYPAIERLIEKLNKSNPPYTQSKRVIGFALAYEFVNEKDVIIL